MEFPSSLHVSQHPGLGKAGQGPSRHTHCSRRQYSQYFRCRGKRLLPEDRSGGLAGLGSPESRLNRSLPVRRICSSSFLCRFMSERTLSRRASRFWLRAELPGEGKVRNVEGGEAMRLGITRKDHLGQWRAVQRPQSRNRQVCSKSVESWGDMKDEAKEMRWRP